MAGSPWHAFTRTYSIQRAATILSPLDFTQNLTAMTTAMAEMHNIFFSGSPGLKRGISAALAENRSPLESVNALIKEEFWESVSEHTNVFASEKQRSLPDLAWFATAPTEVKVYITSEEILHTLLLV